MKGPNDAAPVSACVCPEMKHPGVRKQERKQQKSFLFQNVNQREQVFITRDKLRNNTRLVWGHAGFYNK